MNHQCVIENSPVHLTETVLKLKFVSFSLQPLQHNIDSNDDNLLF